MPLSVFRRWRASDRLMAIALEQYEAMLCPGCGHAMHESMDKESDGEWQADVDRCHACTAAGVLGAKLGDRVAPQALRISTKRKPRAQSS